MTFNLNNINYSSFISILFYLIPFSLGLGPAIPDILLSVIALSFFFFIIINKNWEILKNKFTFFFLCFWIIIVINSFFSENLSISLRVSFFYIRYLFFSLAVYHLINNNKKFLFNTFYSISFSFYLVFFFGYFQLITGFNILTDDLNKLILDGSKTIPQRISGLFGDELVLGGYLVRLFFLYSAIYLFLQKKNFTCNFIFLINFVLFFPLVLYAGERSAVILLFIFLILCFLLLKNFNKIKLAAVIFILTFCVIIFSIDKNLRFRIFEQTLFHQIKPRPQENIENKIFFLSEQHEAHINLAIEIFKDNYIFGAGAKSFSYLCHHYDKKLSENLRLKVKGCSTHPHNTYFQILSETGMVGFLLLIFLIYYLIKRILYLRQIKISKYFSVEKYNFSITLIIIFLSFLFPIMPTGNFFGNWLSIAYYLPVGFFLYSINFVKKK